MPIEAGLRARRLENLLGAPGQSERSAPAARLALGALKDQLTTWAIATHPLKEQEPPLRGERSHTEGEEGSQPGPTKSGVGLGVRRLHKAEEAGQFVAPQKRELPLTVEELERQLRVAEWYVEHRDLPKALLVLREYVVSAVLRAKAATDRWLCYERRKPVEDLLNAVAERAKAHVASETERALASLWSEIATKRNEFAHAGMTEEEVSVSDVEVRDLLERSRALLAGTSLAEIPRPGRDQLLITPLGLSPGVLCSSVSLVEPDRLLIVTSREAKVRTGEALARAGRSDIPRDFI